MNIILDLKKSIHENAAEYYDKVKELKKKREGVVKAIEQTEKELKDLEKEEQQKLDTVKVKKEKTWYQKLHYFFSSEAKLVIGGANAQQNDIIYKKYLEDNDLFFHADIQGASAVILKDGTKASQEEKLETAQFAASFSNAWKNGNSSVDVYCVKRDQLSKHSQGGFIPKGGFAITGEREWFRSTRLALKIGLKDNELLILPENSKLNLDKVVFLFPNAAGKTKGDIVKQLSKHFQVHPDDVMNILPNGKSKLKF